MKIKTFTISCFLATTFVSVLAVAAARADEGEDLAMKLANPVANLISVPIQANYDKNIGPNDDGSVWRINIQPVIPFELNDDWNVITRTIVPLVDQSDIPVKGMSESGLGDITASQFFSPKAPTSGGWIWGVGPVWLLPTASDETLGSEKWGIGPTAVALKQVDGVTYGTLVNHIWSYAGDSDRSDVNATFLQPFVSLTTDSATTFGLNTEATYDWKAEKWSVPINLSVGQLVKVGKLPVSFTAGARYWAEAPEYGPEDWGLRLAVTVLLPK
ncbi:MAG: hypothetical protein P8Y40_01930 [Desulfobacterales bacterium]